MKNFVFYRIDGRRTEGTSHEDGSFTIKVYEGGKCIGYTVYHDCVRIIADPDTLEPMTAHTNVSGRKKTFFFDEEGSEHVLKIRIPA
jgi:hypothetical protein